MPRDNPRIAVLWVAPFGDALQGTELLGEHLRAAFPGARFFTPADVANDFPARVRFRWFRLEDILKSAAVARAFMKEHRKVGFDAVIAQGAMGLPFVFKKPDVPVVHVLNFCISAFSRSPAVIDRKNRMLGRWWGLVERISGARKDRRVTICEDTSEEIKRYYRLSYPDVIPLGVDTGIFFPGDKAAERKELGLPQEGKIALYVGRIEYAKGFDILTEAARANPEVTFVIVAPRSVNVAGRNVVVREKIAHETTAKYYRAADFLVHPSRYESGMCYVLLEAMASNLPVIVSRDVLHNFPGGFDDSSLGIVLDGHDKDAFVEAVRRMAASSMRAGPRKTVEENYSLGLFKRRWQDLMKGLL